MIFKRLAVIPTVALCNVLLRFKNCQKQRDAHEFNKCTRNIFNLIYL